MLSKETETFLHAVRIPLRLGCLDGKGWPVTLSLWYIFADGSLFCVSHASSRVVQYLVHEPRCSFEIAADLPPYCGVRGQALAKLDPAAGAYWLDRLMARYLDERDERLRMWLLSRAASEVAICLHLQRVSTWNYSDRMYSASDKICP